jgi:dGTPase
MSTSNGNAGDAKLPSYLNSNRRRPSEASNASARTILEQAQSDRARVIFSASFRRLAQKTQVFALDSAEVRNRMTHSLEVAHIGIYIVEKVFRFLDSTQFTSSAIAEWRAFNKDCRDAISRFVETACLVHDIGNPPFGHFGEKAIRDWFEKNKNTPWFRDATSDVRHLARDFLYFDGNMQGFRILTRLQRNSEDSYSLNLTYAQLASAIKYPAVDSEKPEKCGFFEAESSIKDEVWEKLGFTDKAHRHPCSLLMEAADDIAYCVSDLEDASEKGLVVDADLDIAFGSTGGGFSMDRGDLIKARTKFTNKMVDEAAKAFIGRLKDQSHFQTHPLLTDESDQKLQKTVTREKVYSSRLVLANEVTGFAVIPGLLERFSPLFNMIEVDFAKLAETYVNRKSFYAESANKVASQYTAELGLLSLLSRKHVMVYLEAVSNGQFPEMFHRMHLVVDLIAGMTDHYALDTFRLVSGQALYGHRH